MACSRERQHNMSKKFVPLIIAAVLACMVMLVTGVFSFSGSVSAEKASSEAAWSQPFDTAESMKIIDLTGDGQDELFIQSMDNVSVSPLITKFRSKLRGKKGV